MLTKAICAWQTQWLIFRKP